jgi:anti-anti-sigma factor
MGAGKQVCVRDNYYSIDVGGPLDGVATVRLGGSLDIGAREDVRDAIVRVEAERVLVDLGNVRFIDSEALAGLIEGFLKAREGGVDIRAVNVRGIVHRVLEVTGTLELFGAA